MKTGRLCTDSYLILKYILLKYKLHGHSYLGFMNIAGTNVYMFIIKYTIEGFKFVHQNLRRLLILVIWVIK